MIAALFEWLLQLDLAGLEAAANAVPTAPGVEVRQNQLAVW